MLRASPTAWYSSEFRLTDGDREVGALKLARLRERATFAVKDVAFELYRESLMGDFVLEFGGAVLARAEKLSVLNRCFALRMEGEPAEAYVLEAASAFTRAFVLRMDEEEVGHIRPLHALTRRTEIDLPEALPLPVQVFCFWLVLVLWNRAAAAS